MVRRKSVTCTSSSGKTERSWWIRRCTLRSRNVPTDTTSTTPFTNQRSWPSGMWILCYFHSSGTEIEAHVKQRERLRWLFVTLIDWLSIDQWIDWLIDCSTDRSIDWLIDWLINWLVHWLLDWAISLHCLFPAAKSYCAPFSNHELWWGVLTLTYVPRFVFFRFRDLVCDRGQRRTWTFTIFVSFHVYGNTSNTYITVRVQSTPGTRFTVFPQTFGGMCGPLLWGFIADRFGRKKAFLLVRFLSDHLRRTYIFPHL